MKKHSIPQNPGMVIVDGIMIGLFLLVFGGLTTQIAGNMAGDAKAKLEHSLVASN